MRLPINPLTSPRLLSIAKPNSSSIIHARQSHNAAAQPSSVTHHPFVWHNATSDDQRRISEDLSYFPRLLSGDQQRTLLSAALGRLDDVGSSHASRRKRIRRLLRSTDTSLSQNGPGTFLPDEYYDFEQVRCHPYRLSLPPPSPHYFPSHLSPRRILTKSSSNFERPASHTSSGPTKKMSSPSSLKSPPCSHQYPSRRTYYTWPQTATSSLTSIMWMPAVPSSLVSV